jgi:hypothetical protein
LTKIEGELANRDLQKNFLRRDSQNHSSASRSRGPGKRRYQWGSG